MKKILFLLFASLCLFCYADPDEIVLTNGGSGDNRSNVSLRVFYDNETQEIIIQGDNLVSYYEVEITSAINGYYELYTLVNGTYDTFDVSSVLLPPTKKSFFSIPLVKSSDEIGIFQQKPFTLLT